ncbi:hypothetical protein LF817_11375 [Halobacillus sp. A1]|uniref:hypothetical protein n=1 Tax=Halobacillus sp. A1 TaxID=2880262 RepID=UPI0020A6B537|nr:hypothetical protein [Halobacillus sp. A1]MCP3031946.1 hypothetical protein [Halobacillus sp. A1]
MGYDESKANELQQLKDDDESKKTQSQILVEMASDIELFHTPDETAYAVLTINEHEEVMPLRKKKFKRWLRMQYYDTFGKVAGSQAVEDALSTLEGGALFKGEMHQVHTRIAEYKGRFYIDLANERYEAIEVSEQGWKVVSQTPVYFKRTNSLGELPAPEPGGSIEQLKPFLNCRNEDDFKMAVAWLLATMRPGSPYPVLLVQGEQGSSKSTTTKVLRSLIDPSETLPLRNLPKSEEELAIAASKAHIGAYDNISSLSNALSDTFCKIALGGSVAKRELYSDDEEAVITLMKPSILNGISDVGKRPDLLDRSIMLNLPSIPKDKRTDEGTFWREFEAVRPKIIGAFLDVVSAAIKELPYTIVTNKPRMADFALWITAAEKALNWKPGEFIELYSRNQQEGINQSLETDPLAVAVIDFMKNRKQYKGTPTEAHELITEYVRDQRTIYSKAWPTPRSIKGRLTRIAPGLRSEGIYFTDLGQTSEGRLIKLERMEEEAPISEDGEDITI